MVKQLLFIFMSTFAVNAIAQSGEKTVLWQGNAILSWDGSVAPNVMADKCTDIIAGDKIILTVSELDAAQDWPSCYLRSAEMHTELCGTGLWDYKTQTMPVDASIEIPYDYKVVNAFKEGFYIVGTGATITEIAIEHCGDPSIVLPTEDNVLWFGKATELSWSNSITIPKDKTNNIQAGQVIAVTIEKLNANEEWPSIRVTSDSWKDITSIPLWDDKEASLPLEKIFDVTAENLPLIQEGFRLDGPGAFVTMVKYCDKAPASIDTTVALFEKGATVYNLQGICIRKATSVNEALNNLPSGIYIVNGKKVKKVD